jgi:hypothetical protein
MIATFKIMNNTDEKATRNPRPTPPDRAQELLPFVRATILEDISLYWIPVQSYPMPAAQRRWLMEFFRLLKVVLEKKDSLREESFLLFKSLSEDLVNRFTVTAQKFMPMPGIALTPGSTPPSPPSFEEAKQEAAASSKKGVPFDVLRMVPDYAYWFLNKDSETQRKEFFGYGGMFMLYLKPDPETQLPAFELPKIMTSHPAFSPKIMETLSAAYAMKDPFLAKSKELFGEPLQDDPSFEGLSFVLPFLNSADFFQATPEEREIWFGLFDGYCIESKADKGLLLALKDPDFDEHLINILKSMEESGERYRL